MTDPETTADQIHDAVAGVIPQRPFVVVWIDQLAPAGPDAPMGAMDAGMGLTICTLTQTQTAHLLTAAAGAVLGQMAREEAEERMVEDFRETLGLPDEETPR